MFLKKLNRAQKWFLENICFSHTFVSALILLHSCDKYSGWIISSCVSIHILIILHVSVISVLHENTIFSW